MKIDKLFPTIIITDYVDDTRFYNIKNEIESIFPQINELLSGDTWGDNVFTTSEKCNCLIKKFNLQNTFNSIDPVIKELAKQLNINSESLELHSSWINITTHLGYQDQHIHGHNFLSGALCLDVPLESGSIQFYPSISETIIKPAHVYISKEGFITVFHGSVPHRVTHNKTKLNRISLSFNYSYT